MYTFVVYTIILQRANSTEIMHRTTSTRPLVAELMDRTAIVHWTRAHRRPARQNAPSHCLSLSVDSFFVYRGREISMGK